MVFVVVFFPAIWCSPECLSCWEQQMGPSFVYICEGCLKSSLLISWRKMWCSVLHAPHLDELWVMVWTSSIWVQRSCFCCWGWLLTFLTLISLCFCPLKGHLIPLWSMWVSGSSSDVRLRWIANGPSRVLSCVWRKPSWPDESQSQSGKVIDREVKAEHGEFSSVGKHHGAQWEEERHGLGVPGVLQWPWSSCKLKDL